MSNISHTIQKIQQTVSGSASHERDPPKPITGNVSCWLWAHWGSWDREQEGHQNQGSVYETDPFKFNAQAMLNLQRNFNFISFFFFFITLPTSLTENSFILKLSIVLLQWKGTFRVHKTRCWSSHGKHEQYCSAETCRMGSGGKMTH